MLRTFKLKRFDPVRIWSNISLFNWISILYLVECLYDFIFKTQKLIFYNLILKVNQILRFHISTFSRLSKLGSKKQKTAVN